MKKISVSLLFTTILIFALSTVAFAATVSVDMKDSFFDPSDVTINVGDTVEWTNVGALPHTSTSGISGAPDSLWDSGILLSGQSFSVTFNSAGVFDYYCTFHWFAGMTGTVTVNGAIDPDIKANGQDGPVTVSQGQTVSITISLDPGSMAGDNVDWWLLADSPFGWYHFDPVTQNWLPGFSVSHQGGLFAIPDFEVFLGTLPGGAYIFYFGVDTLMNGTLNIGILHFDSVEVTVQ